MITCLVTMNRYEQEHLYRQSRQVSIIQSSPVLLDHKEDLLLSVLNSPVTEDRRKSSSGLLHPGFLSAKNRRSSQKSVLSAISGQCQYKDKEDRIDERFGVEESDVDPEKGLVRLFFVFLRLFRTKTSTRTERNIFLFLSFLTWRWRSTYLCSMPKSKNIFLPK